MAEREATGDGGEEEGKSVLHGGNAPGKPVRGPPPIPPPVPGALARLLAGLRLVSPAAGAPREEARDKVLDSLTVEGVVKKIKEIESSDDSEVSSPSAHMPSMDTFATLIGKKNSA